MRPADGSIPAGGLDGRSWAFRGRPGTFPRGGGLSQAPTDTALTRAMEMSRASLTQQTAEERLFQNNLETARCVSFDDAHRSTPQSAEQIRETEEMMAALDLSEEASMQAQKQQESQFLQDTRAAIEVSHAGCGASVEQQQQQNEEEQLRAALELSATEATFRAPQSILQSICRPCNRTYAAPPGHGMDNAVCVACYNWCEAV